MRRRGFTLIEVVVALTVGALTISVAVVTFTATADALNRMTDRAERTSSERLIQAWLAQLLMGSFASSSPRVEFDGASDRIAFHTSTWVPGGWLEPVTVLLSLPDGTLTIRGDSHRTELPLPPWQAATIEYFGSPMTRQGTWETRWLSATDVPSAVRIRFSTETGGRDTLLLLGALR